MKKVLFNLSLILIISAALSQISCKKDDVNSTTSTYQMAGLWEGKYTVTASTQAPLSYFMSVYPGGTITVKGEASPGVFAYSHGTWSLSNNIFTASVTSNNAITQSLTGTYSNTGTLTNATWAVTSSPFPFNAGAFSTMMRIN